MRIDKKTRKSNHYNGSENSEEKQTDKKIWPEDRPIKTFRPLGPTEKTKEEERYNIDTGLS